MQVLLNTIKLISFTSFEQLLFALGILLLLILILGFFKILDLRKENKKLKKRLKENS